MSKLILEVTAYAAGQEPITIRDEDGSVFGALDAAAVEADYFVQFSAQKAIKAAKVKAFVKKHSPEHANGAHSFGFVAA